MLIKAGYRIYVTTWENDGDNYNSKVVEGLTEQEVKAIVSYLKLFTEGTRNGGFGNCYEPYGDWDERFSEAIWYVYRQNTEGFNSMCDELQEDSSPGDVQESITELLDWRLGLCSENFHTRMVEDITITYIPHDVRFEDVTARFI